MLIRAMQIAIQVYEWVCEICCSRSASQHPQRSRNNIENVRWIPIDKIRYISYEGGGNV